MNTAINNNSPRGFVKFIGTYWIPLTIILWIIVIIVAFYKKRFTQIEEGKFPWELVVFLVTANTIYAGYKMVIWLKKKDPTTGGIMTGLTMLRMLQITTPVIAIIICWLSATAACMPDKLMTQAIEQEFIDSTDQYLEDLLTANAINEDYSTITDGMKRYQKQALTAIMNYKSIPQQCRNIYAVQMEKITNRYCLDITNRYQLCRKLTEDLNNIYDRKNLEGILPLFMQYNILANATISVFINGEERDRGLFKDYLTDLINGLEYNPARFKAVWTITEQSGNSPINKIIFIKG